MLEFYRRYHKKKFKEKSEKLLKEVQKILLHENMVIQPAAEPSVPEEYRADLGEELAGELNDLYHTIRVNNGKEHPLLRKYLPELKKEPDGTKPLFADFFSGAGGLGQGLIQAGFAPAFVNDNYLDALETYYFNHFLTLDRFYYGDIATLVTDIDTYMPYLRDVRLIAGGPPCQGFSTANRQNFTIDEQSNEKRFIEDPRNILYKHFVKLLGLIRPEFFIMENVRGMKKVEKQIEEDIRKATHQAYDFSPLVLDAQHFGVPQSRIRYVLVGGIQDAFTMAQLRRRIDGRKAAVGPYKIKDALFGLPGLQTNPHMRNIDYESEANGFDVRGMELEQNTFLGTINGGRVVDYLWNHKARYNNENDLEIFRRLPEGGNALHEDIQDILVYKNRKDIFKDKYYRLKKDEVSKTITSHMRFDCHMYIHPEQNRGLTPREAARVQTFPDDYVFRGNLNSWYKQIGNAVPVKLAEVIGREIQIHIR